MTPRSGNSWRTWPVVLLSLQNALLAATSTLDLSVGDQGSVRTAAKKLADSCMAYYNGDKPGGIPGLLPPSAVGSYNWWESGALWGQMIEYWYYTGDDRYNSKITDGILFQTGPDNNFEPTNQTRTEGNDDQAFWAFAAMTAAETKFPDPPAKKPSWLSLAQAVFNRQAARWDTAHCGGGLRWQFNVLNNGYMDKNTISNGCFFQLAARLAKYTKNDTYAQWAEKTYEWMSTSPLISKNFEVFDSLSFTEQSCSAQPGPIQWTYNIGTMIAGSAFMYSHTNGAQKWKDRIQGYLDNIQRVFFQPQYADGRVMTEYACEPLGNCNIDQRSFKAYLSRWLAVTAQLAPFTRGQIMPWLQDSATAASKVCTVADDGLKCGRKWYEFHDDGLRDVGHQMTAMSVVQSNLILAARPLADINNGDSKSDPGAGGGKTAPKQDPIFTRKMTMADKAGAWIVTLVMVLAFIASAVLMAMDKEGLNSYTGYVGNANGAASGAASAASAGNSRSGSTTA